MNNDLPGGDGKSKGVLAALLSLLFLVAIPWYWGLLELTIPGAKSFAVSTVWPGVPVWFAISVVASAVISCVTAWSFLRWEGPGAEPVGDQRSATPDP